MSKRIILLIGFLIPVIAFSQGRRFSYIERRIYDPLDPYTYMPSPANDRLSSLLFSKLYSRNDEAKPMMDMVKDLTVDPRQNQTAIISLNSGMKWSDGSPVTAEDAVFTIGYLKDTTNELHSDELLRKRIRQIESATVLNATQFKAKFKVPRSENVWEQCLVFSVLPIKALTGKALKPSSTFSARPIGSGPFRLDDIYGGSAFSLGRNLSYHGIDRANQLAIESIIASQEPDDNMRIEKLKSRKADMVVEVPWDQLSVLKSSAEFRVRAYESLTYYYLGCNLRNEVLKNPLVREAISIGLNRDRIIKLAFSGAGKPVSGPYPPSSEYTDPDVDPDQYDPDRAMQLLEAAGHGTNNPVKLRLVYPQEEGSYGNALRTCCNAIRGDCQRIGVQIELEPIPSQSQYLEQVFKQKSFDLAFDRWRFYDYLGDPSELFVSGGYWNYIDYRSLEADAVIRDFRAASTPDAKKALGKKLHKLIAKERPYVFMFQIYNQVAWNKRLEGVRINPFNFFETIPQWKVRD